MDKNESLEQLLKRPEITYQYIEDVSPPPVHLSPEVKRQVEIQVKYEGYIRRQFEMAERLKKIEKLKIPQGFDYGAVNGLSREIFCKLEEVKPVSLGQASRIPGVTPAAISLLMVTIEKLRRERKITS